MGRCLRKSGKEGGGLGDGAKGQTSRWGVVREQRGKCWGGILAESFCNLSLDLEKEKAKHSLGKVSALLI